MRHAVMDVETNNLLDAATTIHSLVIRDLDTDEVVSCADQPGYRPIAEGLDILSKAEIISGHNIRTFDLPVLLKLRGWKPRPGTRIFDTFVATRMRWAHRKSLDFALHKKKILPGNLIGAHSLEAWGYRIGYLKGSFGDTTDWAEWTPEMQAYCERDTAVTRGLVLYIKKAGYSKQAMDMEQELADFLFEMEQGGWPFNEAGAQEFLSMLVGKRETVAQRLRDHFGQFMARNGKPVSPKKSMNKKPLTPGGPKTAYFAGAEYCKLKVVDFNPASRDHIAFRLRVQYGWKPEVFNEKDGKPTVDEVVLKGLKYPPVPDLIEYLLLDKRIGQVSEGKQAWLAKMTGDRPLGGKITGLKHIHARTNAGGTVTHRASHVNPNIAQVPKVGKPYGKESRALFYVPKGWSMVGADESGLELRCLAHYMAKYDDGAYGRVILEGKKEDRTEIHTVNQDALGFPDEPADGRDSGGRDTAKTWFYAYLYGAGDEKLGRIACPSCSESRQTALGKELRKRFEGGLPALGYVVDNLKQRAKTKGWVPLIDGRRAYVRHEHAVLNTLLQGTGAVISKYWVVDFGREMRTRFGPMGWNGQWQALGWIHDEIQTAVREGLEEDTSRIAVATIEVQTGRFNFRVPLTGEAKIGRNWMETH